MMAADGDGAVCVMQDVVTDAAQYCSSNETEAASSHHDHRCLLGRRRLDNRFSRMLTELDDNSSAHLRNILDRLTFTHTRQESMLRTGSGAAMRHEVDLLTYFLTNLLH